MSSQDPNTMNPGILITIGDFQVTYVHLKHLIPTGSTVKPPVWNFTAFYIQSSDGPTQPHVKYFTFHIYTCRRETPQKRLHDLTCTHPPLKPAADRPQIPNPSHTWCKPYRHSHSPTSWLRTQRGRARIRQGWHRKLK